MIQSLCKEKSLIPSGESKLKDKYRYWKIAIKLKMLKEKNFAKERHRVLSLHTQAEQHLHKPKAYFDPWDCNQIQGVNQSAHLFHYTQNTILTTHNCPNKLKLRSSHSPIHWPLWHWNWLLWHIRGGQSSSSLLSAHSDCPSHLLTSREEKEGESSQPIWHNIQVFHYFHSNHCIKELQV